MFNNKNKLMIELIKLDNGNLEIKVINKKDFKEFLKDERDEREALYDLLDDSRYLGNGWDAPTNIGLTEAPALAFGTQYASEDDDSVIGYDELYVYGEYMMKSYLDELNKYNFVIFKKV